MFNFVFSFSLVTCFAKWRPYYKFLQSHRQGQVEQTWLNNTFPPELSCPATHSSWHWQKLLLCSWREHSEQSSTSVSHHPSQVLTVLSSYQVGQTVLLAAGACGGIALWGPTLKRCSCQYWPELGTWPARMRAHTPPRQTKTNPKQQRRWLRLCASSGCRQQV